LAQAVALLILIEEQLGSRLGQVTSYRESMSWFFSVSPDTSRISTLI